MKRILIEPRETSKPNLSLSFYLSVHYAAYIIDIDWRLSIYRQFDRIDIIE